MIYLQSLENLGVSALFKNVNLEDWAESLPTPDTFLHSSKIEVTEEGTKAEGHSFITISRRMIHPTTLKFNRPFVFCIRDEISNVILFAGAVKNPNISI